MNALYWLVAAVEFGTGFLMIGAPAQFGSPAYAAIRPVLTLFGVAMASTGGLMFLCALGVFRGAARAVPMALAALPLLWIAYGFARGGAYTGTIGYGVEAIVLLAFALTILGIFHVAGHPVIWHAAALQLATGPLMLFLPAQFPPAIYQGLASRLGLLGASYLLAGAGLLYSELAGRQRVRAVFALYVALNFVPILQLAIGIRSWPSTISSTALAFTVVLVSWRRDLPAAVSLAAGFAGMLALVSLAAASPFSDPALGPAWAHLSVVTSAAVLLLCGAALQRALAPDRVPLRMAADLALGAAALTGLAQATTTLLSGDGGVSAAELLGRAASGPGDAPVSSGWALVLLAGALLSSRSGWPSWLRYVGAALGALVAAAALMNLLAYVLDAPFVLSALGPAAMRMHAAIAFAALGLGVVLLEIPQVVRGPVTVRIFAGLGLFLLLSVLLGLFVGAAVGELGRLVEQDPVAARSVASGAVAFAYGLLLLVALTIVGMGILISRTITSPLAALLVAINRFAKGEDDARAPIARDDEFTQVARAFNDMADRLARLHEELVSASGAKSEFLSGMSHELRTPMNAILGFSELLREQLDSSLTERQRRHFANITAAGQHLLSLINDVLDLSKVEAGRVELRPEVVELPILVEPVSAAASQVAKDSGVIFVAAVQGDGLVRVDTGRVRQVLYNLLSNALKFTSRGGRVWLNAGLDGDDLCLEVRDTGIGIPQDRRDRVFGRFERLHEGRSEASGTGLGLALTKRLVELHGGTIDFDSEENVGTTFRVRLHDVSARAVTGDRILVIEDERRDADLVTEMANAAGLRAEVVGSALSAREAIRRNTPIGVVLDLRLPDGRGETILEDLRSNPATRAVPVIVVTVEDDDGLVRRLGADDHLTKPLDRARLATWLAKVCSFRAEATRSREAVG